MTIFFFSTLDLCLSINRLTNRSIKENDEKILASRDSKAKILNLNLILSKQLPEGRIIIFRLPGLIILLLYCEQENWSAKVQKSQNCFTHLRIYLSNNKEKSLKNVCSCQKNFNTKNKLNNNNRNYYFNYLSNPNIVGQNDSHEH